MVFLNCGYKRAFFCNNYQINLGYSLLPLLNSYCRVYLVYELIIIRQVTLMKKLLFFDIDGTLVDFGKSTMSPSTADALINSKQNGHMIFLCTGRSYNCLLYTSRCV